MPPFSPTPPPDTPSTRLTALPSLVRIKPGALDRAGIYLQRHSYTRLAIFHSQGFDLALRQRLRLALTSAGGDILLDTPVESIDFQHATHLFKQLPKGIEAIIGFGGGRALDVAKTVASLASLPFFAIPTSLSNDGFCSPQSSLTHHGRRQAYPTPVPFGVILDTAVCLGAPAHLWHSGIGDLAAKFTAVTDWKLAFHATGTPVDDFAALLSDASVYQFIANPAHDLAGTKLLGSALLFNGIAMSIAGSSRPASGSEHLISHSLDSLSARPRLHGLQVGVATYLVSLLQMQNSAIIADLFTRTGFWHAIAGDPFDRAEWEEALRIAPSLKENFHTILSVKDSLPAALKLLTSDPFLRPCFG